MSLNTLIHLTSAREGAAAIKKWKCVIYTGNKSVDNDAEALRPKRIEVSLTQM